jgi:hypothetical protein
MAIGIDQNPSPAIIEKINGVKGIVEAVVFNELAS